MRVLIICPYLHRHGGVSNYFKGILKYISVNVDVFQVGSYSVNSNIYSKIGKLYNDRRNLLDLIGNSSKRYDLIHINPSLLYGSLFRDGILFRSLTKYNIKSIVFFRGWERNYEKYIESLFYKNFYCTFNKADAFIVLASNFREKLRKWGFKQPIYLETTIVDDDLLKGFSLKKRLEKIGSNNKIQILHMARIDNERKGIIESLDAIALLSKKFDDLKFVIAGDGFFIEKAKKHAHRLGIMKDVIFLGHIYGEQKKRVLEESDLFLFPTFSNEGMPNSVLEAMSFGIPLITRPVAGLKDILINGKHGFITKDKNPASIAAKIEKLILDRNLRKKIASINYELASDRFLGSKVAKRIENIYEKTLQFSH